MEKSSKDIQRLGMTFFESREKQDFEVLYRALRPRLERFIMKQFGGTADFTQMDIEDCVSDALCKIYTNINTYDQYFKFSTWSYTIAKNEALKVIYKLKVLKEVSSTSSSGNAFNVEKACDNYLANLGTYNVERNYVFYLLQEQRHSEPNALEIDDIAKMIIEVIEQLEERYRRILIDREVNKLSYNEICEKYSMNMNTCKVYIHKGRKLVQQKLQSIYDEWKNS